MSEANSDVTQLPDGQFLKEMLDPANADRWDEYSNTVAPRNRQADEARMIRTINDDN